MVEYINRFHIRSTDPSKLTLSILPITGEQVFSKGSNQLKKQQITGDLLHHHTDAQMHINLCQYYLLQKSQKVNCADYLTKY